jgi:hypothetical protein
MTIDAVRSAIAGGDVRTLAQLAQDEDNNVVLVPEREAVQVLGCGGRVAAHLRLSRSIVVALAD